MFIHTALTWGFFLALVPLLIHLINLVRRRRVKWAAMDFLLHSYKKHQKWVWLQQLLLLLLRMLAVILAVAMLAQWLAKNHWFSLLGGRVTHHYVLVDDSLSMSERFGGVSAFDKATQTLARIATRAMAQESAQQMTVVRFSRAAGVPQDEAAALIGQLADLNAEPVDAKFDGLIEEKRRSWELTQLAVGPRAALELTSELVRLTPDEGHVLHVLSDFRHQDWANPNELKQLLQAIDDATEQIQFVNCAPAKPQSNLAITELRPADEIRAAGVPLLAEITVTNFGQDVARKIPLKLRSTFFDPQLADSAEPGKLVGKMDEPPAVLIEELAAGQKTTRQVQVFFPRPGQHVLEATLPDDVVANDNRRWCVVDIPEGESVLVVDGDPAQRNAYFLASAFQPGARAATGIRVDAKPSAFLRDATVDALSAYRAVYLLDVDRLEDRAIENLEAFVTAGGGLAIFVGEHVQHAFYTSRLYRNGAGVFPLPLERDDLLPADSEENTPDFEVTNHPLFSVFFGEQNPFIRLVSVERFLRPPLGWTPEPNSGVAVIARLRNRQPFVVERPFGDGRVVTFLTTLAPDWNNWANDPSFVVVLLKLQSYLAAPQRKVDTRLVGSPLLLTLDRDRYRADLTIVAPGTKPDLPLLLRRTATAKAREKSKEDQHEWTASLPGFSRDDANTARGGLYEAWPATVAGPLEVRRFAFNVDPAESDLKQIDSQQLLTSLAPVRARMRRAEDFAFELTEEAGFHRGIWLLLLLVGLLIGEQVLAYFASYHPAPATVVGAVRT